jgi:hypothetical protein
MIIKMIIQSDLWAATPVPSHKNFYSCNLQFSITRFVVEDTSFQAQYFCPGLKHAPLVTPPCSCKTRVHLGMNYRGKKFYGTGQEMEMTDTLIQVNCNDALPLFLQ